MLKTPIIYENFFRGKKRKALKRAIADGILGYEFKYDIIRINQTPDLLINPTTQLIRTSEASKKC